MSSGIGRLAGLILSSTFVGACPSPDEPKPRAPSEEQTALDGVRVAAAWETLRAKLGPEAMLIELRADERGLVAQAVRRFEAPVDIAEFRVDLDDIASKTVVEGPLVVPLRGAGDVRENAFPIAELDLPRITAAFPIARSAVDPADGLVRQLVVRRMLPFNRLVRARIYVDSPRMSGSIDTNSSGTPLKQ